MSATIETFLASFRRRLSDRRFWVVQALVMAIAVGHTTLEIDRALHHTPDLYLVPISTYFIPVLYAALNFGVEGAAPTALWCVLLTFPNIVVFHHGAGRIGVSTQLALLIALGVVVAARVDRERQAKLLAEAANRELAAAQKSLQTYVTLALRAQEDERHRLSRELHDETIQDLVVVKGRLEKLKCRTGGCPADQCADVAVVDAALQKSIDGIRRFCRALRPSVLDDLGLGAALDSLLTEMSRRTNIHVSLQVLGEPTRLGPEPELVIFRVAQEALRNVEHHADARHVVVHLDYHLGGVTLHVADDGRGFDPADVRPDRLGLTGMNERARLIKGDLTVNSRPGKTQVVLDVPTASPAEVGRGRVPVPRPDALTA